MRFFLFVVVEMVMVVSVEVVELVVVVELVGSYVG